MLFNNLQYVIGKEFENGRIIFADTKNTENSKLVKYHYVTGFHIPSLPVSKQAEEPLFTRHVFRRFVAFLRNMRHASGDVAFGLYAQASPEKSQLGARVNFYLLCRASDKDDALSFEEARDFAERAYANFPRDGLMGLVVPRPAKTEEIEQLLFCDVPDQGLHAAQIFKHTENITIDGLPSDVPNFNIQHPFLSDAGHEPWADLIEILGKARFRTVLSINLEAVNLSSDVPAIAEQAQQYRKIHELNQRRFEIQQSVAGMAGGSIAGMNDPNKLLFEASWYKILRIPDSVFSYIERGYSCFTDLLAWSDQAFIYGISIASEGKIRDLVDAARGSLMSLDNQRERSQLGWSRPDSSAKDKTQALNKLRWMDHSDGKKATGHDLFKYLVTAEEASILFHVPVFSPSYQSSAVSLVDSPFTIPPEVLSVDRFKTEEKLISVGNLYQRDQITSVDFKIRLDDLRRPSLLVGAPGSGKSNLALSLISQLWEGHQTPFLVLDPSTGHEYRYLLADSKYTKKLRDDLIVFTCGDEEGIPFRFNPFDVPPGITLRAHITRLLSCFKAAYEMWDPLPAIYESALIRLYTSNSYHWALSDKGGTGKSCPCMSEFAQAIIDELNENVLPDYGDSSEASGILTGASKIRVNGILNSIGHIINVKEDGSEYFQKLLRRPVVIELGSVGDTSSIALVMAFLVTQLAGHIEYAYNKERKNEKTMHLILIEEAHRMLSAEASGSSSQNQGNTRGKSAEELNTLLAEVRKFHQGIMILDQRPSSLIGGVLDNSDINIMCRLNDRAGFEHLSNVTNLSPEQQKYARTRFQPGDAVLLDKDSGLPVLIKAEYVVDDLLKAYQENFALMRENADRYGLLTLAAEPWSPWQLKKDMEMGANVLGQVIQAPLKTCAFCIPYQKEMQCPYFDGVSSLLNQTAAFEAQIQQWLERVGSESYKSDDSLSIEEHAVWKKDLDAMLSQMLSMFGDRSISENDTNGVRYCYFAQAVDRWQHNDLQSSDSVIRWKRQVAGFKLLQYLYESSSDG
ncbi:MAG TPA: hypothetical protein DIW27_12365 [Cytophagales bacterium]|nr:hypothetical protein [Cytophagales bacterium]HRJ55146.1 ATP-binding protein [Anaerolineales bacterium]